MIAFSHFAERHAARLRLLVMCACFAIAPCAAAWIGANFPFATQVSRTEIYRGVFYQTMQRSGKIIHLVEIDLNCPGIELFLTPLHPEAVANGQEYRLDYVRNVARSEGLAVAVNGTLFKSDSYLIPMVGDFATTVDTVVSDHKVNHLQPLDFMLWFDDRLTPHGETSRPAPLEVLQKAKWAIGTRDIAFKDIHPRDDGSRDKRAAIGIDLNKRKLWIAVFESATQSDVIETLKRAGAEHEVMLDGGNSTSLYLAATPITHLMDFGSADKAQSRLSSASKQTQYWILRNDV